MGMRSSFPGWMIPDSQSCDGDGLVVARVTGARQIGQGTSALAWCGSKVMAWPHSGQVTEWGCGDSEFMVGSEKNGEQ